MYSYLFLLIDLLFCRYNNEGNECWSDSEGSEINGEADNDNVKGMKTNLIVSQSQPFRLSEKVNIIVFDIFSCIRAIHLFLMIGNQFNEK